jgi:hypothetical protein
VAFACALLAASAFNSLPFELINQTAPAVCWQLGLILAGGVALVGYLENGVLSSQRAGFWINGPRCFRSRSGPKLPVLSMYSDPPSRIDGRVLKPAHQSIPDLQIEADAMKTKAADLDGQQRFARSSRNPPRTCTGAHSSRQLPGQGPPAS